MKFLLGLIAVLGSIGCGDGGFGIGPPSPGAFGQANVSPECGAFHQACISRGLDSPLAVGSRLGLGVSFELPGSSGPPTGLESTDPSVLRIADGVLSRVDKTRVSSR